ncbi:hypothetical protein ACP70R_011509 [Stipagrostis hirtigluma subsp. patula]
MRKEIIIRMQPESDKCRNKALKVAASVSGVESVTVTGRDRDLLLVIGDGVDAGKLTKNLKKEVGEAEIVELRTQPPGTSSTGIVVTRSPYKRHPTTPGRSLLPGGEIVECPAAAARWPGEHSWQAGHHARTPSPWHCHYPPPMAGQGGYGYAGAGTSSYAREVARSHPVNYSPMIARHDVRAVGRRSTSPRTAGEGCHGRGDPNCCSIL